MLATPELILEAAQHHKLAALVPEWLEKVPLYKAMPGTLDTATRDTFYRLPQITKHDIRRDFPDNFLRDGVELDDLLDQNLIELEHTSGTSEERTPLLLGLGWWAEQEERALRLNRRVAEVFESCAAPRRVTISSPVCNGDVCYSGVPPLADRMLGNTLYASLSRHPFLWSERELARIAAETAEWKPQFLDVDPVYGVVFARYCERHGIRFPTLRFILCSYEFVSVCHRRILERAFGVPVYNLYGSTETGHLLMEDEHGRMKPSFDTAYLEVVDPDSNGIGSLVVTTLTNDFMPLIRYRIGDLAERHEQPYRTVFNVHGRAADAFTRPDGERVTTWQIDECFGGVSGIAHYQLLQRRGADWLLRFVSDKAAAPANVEELKERILLRLGIRDGLSIEEVDALMPEQSGKFRLGYPDTWNAQASRA